MDDMRRSSYAILASPKYFLLNIPMLMGCKAQMWDVSVQSTREGIGRAPVLNGINFHMERH